VAWQDEINRHYGGRPGPQRPAPARPPLPTTGTVDTLMAAITTLQQLAVNHEQRLRRLEQTPYLPQRSGYQAHAF
jgi:hypothetical protein